MAEPIPHHMIEWHDEPAPPAIAAGPRLALAGAAVEREPRSARLHLQLGLARAATGDHQGAAEAIEAAVRLEPSSRDAARALERARAALAFEAAKVAVSDGRHDDAVRDFERALAIEPAHYNALHALVSQLAARGALDDAARACDISLSRAPGNTPALALKAQVLVAAGFFDAAAVLLAFDDLLQTRMLDVPAGFNASLAGSIRASREMQYEPERRTARLGYRGRLDPDASVVAASLRERLRREVEAYTGTVVAGREHPFALAAPSRAVLGMWGLVLQEGGHVVPHIHPAAWMSGVYYVEVPERQGDAGELELGSAQAFAGVPEGPVRRVAPEPGLLVLFPSYYSHRSIPTRSARERICVAFDVLSVL